MKTWKHGIIGVLAIIAFALAFITCDDDNGKTETEQPQYRTDTITFAFLDREGNPIDDYKGEAEVQGTMLLADWNNAKTTIKTKIESAQHNGDRFERADFVGTFQMSGVYENDPNRQIAKIIFDPNAGNGKYEVKDGEWRKLYINPTALNSITEAELKVAIHAMFAEESTIALMKIPLNVQTFAKSIIAQWNKTFIAIMG